MFTYGASSYYSHTHITLPFHKYKQNERKMLPIVWHPIVRLVFMRRIKHFTLNYLIYLWLFSLFPFYLLHVFDGITIRKH